MNTNEQVMISRLTDIDADPDNHIGLAFWQTILESHGDLIQN